MKRGIRPDITSLYGAVMHGRMLMGLDVMVNSVVLVTEHYEDCQKIRVVRLINGLVCGPGGTNDYR